MAESQRSVTTANKVNGVLPKPATEVEVGYSQHLPFVTPYRNVWEMLRSEEITVRQLVTMRKTDGQARALYRLVTLPIRAALKTATFVPEDHVDGGEDEAAFCEQMFTMPASAGGMTVPFNRVISQLLMAIFDGFSAFEMVYWVPKSGPLKNKWTLKKLAYRPSESLTFLIDDNGDYAGLRQRTVFEGRTIDVKLPAEHTIYYAANEEERPFYGQSYFQSAFFHWDKKFKLYIIAHIAAQRAAVGTRIGKLPRNPTLEDKNAFKKALSDLGVAQSMTVPPDFEVESLKESVGFDFLAYIHHHNSQMSKSVLAAFFDKEQGGDSGKLVDFGQQSDALFMLMLQTIMGEIEDVINNKVIPRFIDWNFGSQKYPKFQFGSLSREQKAAMMELFKSLATAGQSLTIRPEFVHELEKQAAEELGLELDWETIEEQMEAEKALQAQQDQLTAETDLYGQPAAPGGAPAGPAGAAAPQHPVIDPSLLPPGFTLSMVDDDPLTLSDLAADLLAEAYNTVELVRGKARQGFKRVQTAEGARVYGVPVGTPITRDIAERAAAHGPKGAPYGEGKKTGGKQMGGGPGAKAQNPGGVVTSPDSGGLSPQRILANPKAPGAQLLDYGDGTVAITDANGYTSPRQRFDVSQFAKYGWTVQSDAGKGGGDTAKAADSKK